MLNLFAALRDPGQRHDVEDLHEQIKALESDRVLLSQQLEKFSSSAGQPGVDVHIAPPTAQGSRRAQLVHKVHGLLHTLRLEVGILARRGKLPCHRACCHDRLWHRSRSGGSARH